MPLRSGWLALAEPVFRSADLIGIRGEGGRERSAPRRTTPLAPTQSARSPSAIASFIESPPPSPPPPQSSHYRAAAIAARPAGDTGSGKINLNHFGL